MTKRRKTSSRSSISKHPHFCKLLNEAIKDETQGAKFYVRMRGKARCKAMKGKFQGMVNDERRHKKSLSEMKRKFC